MHPTVPDENLMQISQINQDQIDVEKYVNISANLKKSLNKPTLTKDNESRSSKLSIVEKSEDDVTF